MVNQSGQTFAQRLPKLLAASFGVLAIIPVMSIASAYAIHLSTPVLTPPVAASAATRFARIGEIEGVHMAKHKGARGDDLGSDIKGSMAPSSNTFMGRLVEATSKNRSRLLWSVYPASVRGQVFSGQAGGNNPLMSVSGGW